MSFGVKAPDPPPPPPPPRPPNQLGAKQLSMAALRQTPFPRAGFRSLIAAGPHLRAAANPLGTPSFTSQIRLGGGQQ